MINCKLCGSGVTATEKFKKQQNGNVHRYVYYGCTKNKDKNCKCGYLEEKELLKQFEIILEKVNFDEIEIKEKIKNEVERFKKFQRVLLGNKEKIEVGDIDIRNYAKYILRDGSDIEKRELLGCLRSRVAMGNKVIELI